MQRIRCCFVEEFEFQLEEIRKLQFTYQRQGMVYGFAVRNFHFLETELKLDRVY